MSSTSSLFAPEVFANLQTALAASEAAARKLAEAESKLEPLRQAFAETKATVDKLMEEYQRANGNAPGTRKRRSTGSYNISPEAKVERVQKSAYTRAISKGMSEAAAKKHAKEIAGKLAVKLGL